MFHRFLLFLVILITLADGLILLGVFGIEPFAEPVKNNLEIFISVFCLQLPLVYFAIYKAYIYPIEELKQWIAKFHTWVDSVPNLIPNSWSRGMNDIITFFQKSLKILSVFRDEIRSGRQLKSEVEIASEIQKQALDKTEDIMPGLTLATGICSASEVGWDSMDVVKWQNWNYYFYIGDVTGHWVASGFVMMMVNALISAFSQNLLSGAEILAETNKILKPRIKQNMMMTAVMLRWDSENKKIFYTGAGHEFILIYKAKEQQIYKIKTGWVALGMMKNISKALKEQQIPFENWDLIILYTDWVTEARYRSEQNWMLFGVDRITASIMSLAPTTRNPENVFRKLTLDLSAFMWYKYIQYDDITFAVIGFTPQWEESVIMTDIASRIDQTSITEWNWWRKNK